MADPGEGGWWYDTARLVRILGRVPVEARADALTERAKPSADHFQRQRAAPGSMAYSGGQYRAFAFEELPPAKMPEWRPRWE